MERAALDAASTRRKNSPADDNSARGSDHENKRVSQNQGPSQEPLQGFLAFDVAGDDEMKVVRDTGYDPESRALGLSASGLAVGELSRALSFPQIGGDAVEIACKQSALAVGEKIKRAIGRG